MARCVPLTTVALGLYIIDTVDLQSTVPQAVQQEVIAKELHYFIILTEQQRFTWHLGKETAPGVLRIEGG
jgi:hypothetical protein